MNSTLRAIIGVILILVITFSVISICQNTGKRIKLDVTDQKIYTLSKGTRTILNKLNQPITAKLFYAKTASLKGPDQIRFFNNYYEYVKALLEEYVNVSDGKVQLEIIDPRPYSKEEEEAIRYGLRRFSITQEESYFFGLVVQTQFGVEKTIPFFAPERQNFLEYDISYLIDTAITRQKRVVGIMSSLPVMGDELSDYMRQMMQYQGQQIQEPWTIVTHLKQQYEVQSIATDVNDINDVDLLLVIHPKDLPAKTRFAIDQYVLKGGRAIVLVDPYCYVDQPDQSQAMQMQGPPKQNSNLPELLKSWGLEMPDNTFAGDATLATLVPGGANQRPVPLIGYLTLKQNCFNEDNAITAELNNIRMPFVGAFNRLDTATDPNADSSLDYTPLLQTTAKGNTWTISSPYELRMGPEQLRQKFIEGREPVTLGYLVTGKFQSAFPDGIESQVEQTDPNDPNETVTVTKKVTGLTEATEDGAVMVVGDVDFISDGLAYQNTFFGAKAAVGDNSALLLNAIEGLFGSNELMTIRSQGNYERPFELVDKIEKEAEKATQDEVDALNAVISGYNQKLQSLASQSQDGEQQVIGSDIVAERRELETKIAEAKRKLNEVKLNRRKEIEALGNRLQQWDMLTAPAVILCLAIVLGIRRTVRKRHYISHASDA